MVGIGRGSLLRLGAISILLVPLTFPQNRTPSSHDSQKQTLADHGLSLVLSQDQTPERPDSPALKSCLVNHPPLACAPLTLELKNEGKETLLTWSSSCGDTSIGFDLMKPDGTWGPIPSPPFLVCSSNVLTVRRVPPGKSYTLHVRLADPNLTLDTAFPKPGPGDGPLHEHPEKGYVRISGPGPYTIRARWDINGCAASDKLKPESALNPFSVQSLCVNGSALKPHFASLTSNEIPMAVAGN